MNDLPDSDMTCLKLAPTLEQMETVCAFFSDALEEAGAPTKTVTQVNIVVDEVFTNIASYSGATQAVVSYRMEPNKMTMQFFDNGTFYDPTQAEDPDVTLSAEDRKIGGLGIFLVRKMMDSVSYDYRNSCNILTLEKHW